MKSLQPDWLRPGRGATSFAWFPGGREEVVKKLPAELNGCLGAGGHTTLMVWADCDDNCSDPEAR